MRAALASNLGDTKLEISFVAPKEFKTNPGYDVNVDLSSVHWADGGKRPLKVSAEGVWLAAAELRRLHGLIAQWLALPLDKLATAELVGSFELSGGLLGSLRLTFVEREDESSARKPYLSVEIELGFFHARERFGTDQSCLALFANELAACLA
jgi:hypothetical protein